VQQLGQRDWRSGSHGRAIFQGNFSGALQRFGAEALQVLLRRLLYLRQFTRANVRQLMTHLQ
jgi:hypothetical protein